MTTWEYYQGDGEHGPFGYVDGWFISWEFAAGELTYDIERDEEDGDEPAATEDETREFVTAWLAKERAKEYSQALSTLGRKCHELASKK